MPGTTKDLPDVFTAEKCFLFLVCFVSSWQYIGTVLYAPASAHNRCYRQDDHWLNIHTLTCPGMTNMVRYCANQYSLSAQVQV